VATAASGAKALLPLTDNSLLLLLTVVLAAYDYCIYISIFLFSNDCCGGHCHSSLASMLLLHHCFTAVLAAA